MCRCIAYNTSPAWPFWPPRKLKIKHLPWSLKFGPCQVSRGNDRAIQFNIKGPSMPLHTYIYTCGHIRYVQGRECSCFYEQLMRINERNAFLGHSSRYLPFDYDNCRHNRTVYREHECRECRELRRRQREQESMWRYGGDQAPWNRYQGGFWWGGRWY